MNMVMVMMRIMMVMVIVPVNMPLTITIETDSNMTILMKIPLQVYMAKSLTSQELSAALAPTLPPKPTAFHILQVRSAFLVQPFHLKTFGGFF